MVEFPEKSGPYRMHTESGNVYWVVIDYRFYSDGQASVYVFQPKTFRSETFMGRSATEVCKEFAPTSFEPLVLCDPNGDKPAPCLDLQWAFDACGA